jgi:hypothetical protein
VLHSQAEASARPTRAMRVRQYRSQLRNRTQVLGRLASIAVSPAHHPAPARPCNPSVSGRSRGARHGQRAPCLRSAAGDRLSSRAGGFKGAIGASALNTGLHFLSVLSKAHTVRGCPNPTRDVGVQELVRRIRRAYASRGVRPAAARNQHRYRLFGQRTRPVPCIDVASRRAAPPPKMSSFRMIGGQTRTRSIPPLFAWPT